MTECEVRSDIRVTGCAVPCCTDDVVASGSCCCRPRWATALPMHGRCWAVGRPCMSHPTR